MQSRTIYNQNKLWFEENEANEDEVTLGVTAESLENLGEIRSIDFPKVGDYFEIEDIVCELDTENGTVRIYCPVAGEVFEVNEILSREPSMLEDDPDDEAWLVRIRKPS